VIETWDTARWKNRPLTLKDLHDVYSKAWAAPGDDPRDWENVGEENEEKAIGWRLVETYIRESNIPPNVKPDAVEVPVETDLHHHGLPKLIGILDLVQPGKIIDYKTSGQTPNAEKVAHITEVQTSIYSVLYRDATGKRELTRHATRHWQRFPLLLSTSISTVRCPPASQRGVASTIGSRRAWNGCPS
jgi:putative RecB family exonuclease